MSSTRTRKTLVATAPDGTEVTEQTAGGYTVAGLIQRTDGTWVIAAHGHSEKSVKSRTSMLYGRGYYKAFHVTALIEVTAPVLREYFGTHAIGIDQVFRTGSYTGLSEEALRAILDRECATRYHGDAIREAVEQGTTVVSTINDGPATIRHEDGTFSMEVKGGWYYTWQGEADYTVIDHPLLAAGRSVLRQIARDGWTAISVRHGDRTADFQVSEILKSLNARS